VLTTAGRPKIRCHRALYNWSRTILTLHIYNKTNRNRLHKYGGVYDSAKAWANVCLSQNKYCWQVTSTEYTYLNLKCEILLHVLDHQYEKRQLDGESFVLVGGTRNVRDAAEQSKKSNYHIVVMSQARMRGWQTKLQLQIYSCSSFKRRIGLWKPSATGQNVYVQKMTHNATVIIHIGLFWKAHYDCRLGVWVWQKNSIRWFFIIIYLSVISSQ